MKSHSIPSLLGIAAVLIAALVVAIAFGVATDSPTAQAQATEVDYDTDDDGLIEITTKGQLAVIDANGRGLEGQGDDEFDAAFPNPADGMGCPDGDDFGSEPDDCTGYELMADIDLKGDDWTPISNYDSTFEGNGNTISGLTINANDDGNYGLFASLGSNAEVRNLSLTGVSVTVMATTNASGEVNAGGLAGTNAGTVWNSHVAGDVTVNRGDLFGENNVGGLLGDNTGVVSTSTSAMVTVNVQGSDSGSAVDAGGLVGENASGSEITGSYATGNVTVSTSTLANAGGLAGNNLGVISASYATETPPPRPTRMTPRTRVDSSAAQAGP